MKCWLNIIAACLLLTQASGAQLDQTLMITDGWMNGRWWNALDRDSRMFYICGLQDGAIAFQALADSAEGSARKKLHANVVEDLVTRRFTRYEVADEMSKLYDEPANVLIPVPLMCMEANKVLQGETPAQLIRHLANLRTLFNSTSAVPAFLTPR